MIPTADNEEVNAALAQIRKALGIEEEEKVGRVPVGFPGATRALRAGHHGHFDSAKHPRIPHGHGGGQFTRIPGTDGHPNVSSADYKRHNPKPSTTGTGTKADPIKTNEVDIAARALGEDKYVELSSPREVSTLLDKLAANVEDAKEKGTAVPSYDLCHVTVPGTDLFCVSSKGIPRIMMPQLKARPVPGSEADHMPKNDKGEVDLNDQFVAYLKKKGIGTHDAEVPPEVLKASQRQLNGGKVAGMSKAMDAGKIQPSPIFVTQDDYIVDGHHRWAANVAQEIKKDGAVPPMPVRVIEEDIIPILALANVFALLKGIPPAGVGALSPRALYELLDRTSERRGAWDSAKHPRIPHGHGGGEFAHKPTGEEPSFGPSKAGDPQHGVGKTDTQYEMDDEKYAAHVQEIQQIIDRALADGKDTVSQYAIDADRGVWQMDRARQHKEIVDHFYSQAAGVPNEGKGVIAGGLFGAGKTTVLNKEIDRSQYLTLSADDIKEEMFRRGMIPHVDGLSPLESSSLIQYESGHISDLLSKRAYAERKNVIWDASMSNADATKGWVAEMRQRGYTHVEGVFVDIPVETSLQRAKSRHRAGIPTPEGGRFVPPALILRNASKTTTSTNREAFDRLRGQGVFDGWSLYDNSGTAPALIQHAATGEKA